MAFVAEIRELTGAEGILDSRVSPALARIEIEAQVASLEARDLNERVDLRRN